MDIVGEAGLVNGPLSRPEGEKVSGHRKRTVFGEASPGALANSLGVAEDSTTPSPASPRVSIQKVVRSSARFQVVFTRAQADDDSWSDVPESKALRAALREASKENADLKNFLMRELVRRDTEALDAFRLKHQRRPKNNKEWPPVKISAKDGLNLYALGRTAFPLLSAASVALAARFVANKWQQERWDTLIHQERSAPHFRVGGAFLIRRDNAQVLEDRVVVTLFSSQREDRRFHLPIIVRDTRQRELLRNCANGTWRHGTVSIEQDQSKGYKWYVRISYTRLVERKPEGIAAGINRGIKNFLAVITESGDQLIHEGADIEAYLKQVQKRRISRQRQVKFTSRTGRGRKRALQPIKILQDKAARWRATRNQTIARRTAEWLYDRDVKVLYMEDFTDIRHGEPERLEGGERIWQRVQEWPYYDLGSRITSCLEELGVEVVTVPAHYITQKCPSCGHTTKENRNLSTWRFRCTACGYSRNLDVAAAMNVLARGKAAHANGARENDGLGDAARPKNRGARKRSQKSKDPAG